MAKILAIDDNNDNLISLKAIIDDAFSDSVLYTALNGQKGIELAISEDPDVILLDIFMPVMDGFEVCQRLKQDAQTRDIPVIFLTAIKTDKESRIRALEIGAEAFLSKPVDETELIAQIRAMVKIKEASKLKRDEEKRLRRLVAERTHKLELSQIETLNLLKELKAENEIREKTESALRKSEGQLRGIFDNLQDAYLQADLSGKFIIVSPSALRMYKYETADELIGKDATLLYADPAVRTALISELKSKVKIEDFVVQGRKKDGTVFWVSMNVQLRYDELGEIVGTEGVVRDVTQRKLSQEQLKRSLSLLNATLESTADGILVVDNSGNISGFNKKFVEFLKVPDSILLTRDDATLISFVLDQLNDPEGFLKKVKELYSNEEKTSFDLVEFKDGRTLERYSQSQKLDGKNVGRVWSFRDITERKLVEEALQKSEKRYRQLVEQSPNGIAIYQEGRFVYVNPAGLAIFGGDHQNELIGKPVLSVVHPDSLDDVINRMGLVAKGIAVPALEEKLVRFDGTPFDAEVIALSTTFNDKPAGQVIVWDITLRKQAEDALRESQVLYHSFVEHMPAGVFRKDRDGRYIFVNSVFCQLKGLKAEEILGKTPKELADYELTIDNRGISETSWYQPTLVSLGDEHHEYIMRTGDSVELEEVYPHPDGTIQYMQVVKSPVFSSTGKVIGSQGIQFEITKRKLAEKELQESNELNSSLLKTIPFGMDIVDEEGNILFQSDNMKKLAGYNTNGLKCWEIYRDDKCQCTDCPLISDIKIGETDIYETHGVLGGKTFQISHTGMLFRGKKAMLEIFQDITQRKETEDELIAAKERAEESDRLKSAFLANMSHEIRTPLNSIIGFSDLMTDPDFDSAQQLQFARLINNSGNNLLTIISDIMDLSKIESGQVQIKKRLVSAVNLIGDIQKEYSFRAREKGIQLQLDLPNTKEEVFLESDEDRLRQILVNFVGNALKFTHNGFVKIGTKKEENFVHFYVKDSGIGIPKEFHQKIFERFCQVETGNARKYGGNGLGLSISKSLTELLGGEIGVESEPGKGSNFYIKIPIC